MKAEVRLESWIALAKQRERLDRRVWLRRLSKAERRRRGTRLKRFMKLHPDAGLITAQTFQDLLTIARKR